MHFLLLFYLLYYLDVSTNFLRQGMDILEECDVRNRLGGGVLRNFSLRKKAYLFIDL